MYKQEVYKKKLLVVHSCYTNPVVSVAIFPLTKATEPPTALLSCIVTGIRYLFQILREIKAVDALLLVGSSVAVQTPGLRNGRHSYRDSPDTFGMRLIRFVYMFV